MRDSVRLGSINGIRIGLHWSVLITAALFTFALASGLLPQLAPGYGSAAYTIAAAATAVVFMASIIAHELGHSLVAQRNDVGVSGITLFALGGVAKLETEPDNPGAAARIALAGPAVSVGIGVASLAVAGAAGTLGLPGLVIGALTWLGIINLIMAVFNMIPALPLDGGRTLQALLWHRNGDRDRATVTAASVGRFLGWAIIAYGLWQFLSGGAGLWTAVIGWFIMTSARAEGLRARFAIQQRNWAPPMWPPRFDFHAPPPDPRQRFDPHAPSNRSTPQRGDGPIEVTGRRVN